MMVPCLLFLLLLRGQPSYRSKCGQHRKRDNPSDASRFHIILLFTPFLALGFSNSDDSSHAESGAA
jgi:hypothetical protein